MEYKLKQEITPENFQLYESAELVREMNAAPKQYRDFKEKHPYADVVILFQVGDFYEAYCEDAKTCADILGVTLNKSTVCNLEKMYRFCGFPKHCLNEYVAKIVRSGKRVALCEPIK
jgi:DNA mismatch repair protein MutS